MGFEAGDMLLHYRLAERIGEGGMGVVWRALDTTLDREAKLLASLNHPNLAAIYGLHEAAPTSGSGRPLRFLALELIRGPAPAADKKRLVFPGGHSVPRTEMIRESLQWLDRYLGPVGG